MEEKERNRVNGTHAPLCVCVCARVFFSSFTSSNGNWLFNNAYTIHCTTLYSTLISFYANIVYFVFGELVLAARNLNSTTRLDPPAMTFGAYILYVCVFSLYSKTFENIKNNHS